MSISLVQSQTVVNPATASGSFASPTTAGNCVVVMIYTYNTSNVTITTTAVTLGLAAGNFAQAAAIQSGYASSETDYVGCWVDPNCAVGQTAIACTITNGTFGTGSGTGLILMEFSGVTATSPVDVSASGSAVTGTALTSGTTGATNFAGEMAVGATYPFSALTAEDGTYTNILLGSVIGAAGYKTVSSAGSTVSYTGTQTSSDPWAALVITLKAAAAFSAPKPLTVSQAVKRAATY